jgi:hypothetical protein
MHLFLLPDRRRPHLRQGTDDKANPSLGTVGQLRKEIKLIKYPKGWQLENTVSLSFLDEVH